MSLFDWNEKTDETENRNCQKPLHRGGFKLSPETLNKCQWTPIGHIRWPPQVAQNSDLHKRYMFKYSVQVKEAKSANLKLRPDLLGQMELMEAKLHMTDPQV